MEYLHSIGQASNLTTQTSTTPAAPLPSSSSTVEQSSSSHIPLQVVPITEGLQCPQPAPSMLTTTPIQPIQLHLPGSPPQAESIRPTVLNHVNPNKSTIAHDILRSLGKKPAPPTPSSQSTSQHAAHGDDSGVERRRENHVSNGLVVEDPIDQKPIITNGLSAAKPLEPPSGTSEPSVDPPVTYVGLLCYI